MRKHIPNFITSLNIVAGTFSIYLAVQGFIDLAAYCILLAAFFDFFDGFAARLLKAQSPIGVDLDSLADVISFGVAPAMIMVTWLQECFLNLPPAEQYEGLQHLAFFAFIIPVFSAVRLAKFNHDKRQTTAFIGLPTPANAIFFAFIPFAVDTVPHLGNFWVLLGLILIFSLLLVSEIWLFALKFKSFKIKNNIIRYSFLLIAATLIVLFHIDAFPLVILTYILISLATQFLIRTSV